MSLRRLAAVLSVLLGCSSPAADPDSEPEPFPGSVATLEELGRRALTGVVAGDTTGLERIRLDAREHNEVIYPEFPAAASFPVEMAWENIELRNRRDLSRQLAWFAGEPVEYRGTFCRGETQEYETFLARTDCWVAFDHPEHGALRVQLFKDVIVRGGGHKLVRYYDEAPERLESGT